MKTEFYLAVLIAGLEICSAFVPTLVSCRGLVGRVQKLSSAGSAYSSPALRASSANVVDAVFSDGSPPKDDPPGTSGGASPPPEPDCSLANDLLQAASSGVGKGYILSSEADKNAIEELVIKLETSKEEGRNVEFPRDLDKLDGRWKLVYTNNMAGLGKLSPVTLKDVYQVVNTTEKTLTNVVYGVVSPPLFAETWGRLGQRVADIAKTVEKKATFPLDFSIKHTFEVSNNSTPAQIELIQKELKVLNVEDETKRSVAFQALQAVAKATGGRFDTTFLSQDLRIGRGRFGELRIFKREA